MIPNQWYASPDAEEVTAADGPIMMYRRRRLDLIDAAECAEIDKAHAGAWQGR